MCSVFILEETALVQIAKELGDEWIQFLRSFPSLAIISGFLPCDIPGIGTFYDLFNKLYLMDKDKSLAKGKTRFKGPTLATKTWQAPSQK